MVFDREGSKFANVMVWDEHQGDPAVLGARACAELLRQGARDIIQGIPH